MNYAVDTILSTGTGAVAYGVVHLDSGRIVVKSPCPERAHAKAFELNQRDAQQAR